MDTLAETEAIERAELEFLREENEEWRKQWAETNRLLYECQLAHYQQTIKDFLR